MGLGKTEKLVQQRHLQKGGKKTAGNKRLGEGGTWRLTSPDVVAGWTKNGPFTGEVCALCWKKVKTLMGRGRFVSNTQPPVENGKGLGSITDSETRGKDRKIPTPGDLSWWQV